jgi:hypothetical protein
VKNKKAIKINKKPTIKMFYLKNHFNRLAVDSMAFVRIARNNRYGLKESYKKAIVKHHREYFF